jgi:hypothetical protein
MTGPFIAQKWVDSLDKMAARGINAVILDAKDYQGPVTYPSKAKMAVEIGAAARPSIPDLARAIRFAHWRGIRVSLRIPCFHDPMADKKAKDGRLSLKSATSGQPVHIDWLDPTNVEAQDYAIEIAKEGIEAGADEINLDYVRFPVHITERFAKLPDPSVRSGIIRDFVKRSEPQRQPAQARQIVEDAVDLAGIELRRRNVAIHTYVAQRLPTMMVDPILIEQVVLNLLKNAAEAIDNARLPQARRNIELRVVPRHTADEGEVIEFSVTDMGPGLKEEVIGRLYEAFFSTKAEGMGIGLSLCRSIVESHRGRMKAQNLYNGSVIVGCRFSFTLPVELPARHEVAAPVQPEAEPAPPPNPTVIS